VSTPNTPKGGRFRTYREEQAWTKFAAAIIGAIEAGYTEPTTPSAIASYAAERADAMLLEFRARTCTRPNGPAKVEPPPSPDGDST
jgi:hypothetical protein